jgi:ActR/RegA family two-component response regulator
VQGEFEQLAKRSAEARAAGEYEWKKYQFEAKERGAMLLSELGNSHVTSMSAFIQELSSMPDKNVARLKLGERFAQVEAGIASLSGSHPELASNWKGVFANMRKLGEDALSPAAKTEEVENQLRVIKAQAQLMALSDPRMVKVYALNALAPQAAASMADLNKVALDALANISSPNADTKIQVVGVNGDVAKTFDALKVVTKEYIRNPSNPDAQVQITEANRTILNQIDKSLVTGAKAGDLTKAADYVASPEFSQAMKNGLVDKEHAKNALTAFQYLYEQNVAKSVVSKLDEKVPGAKDKTFGQSVELKWAGSSVQLEKKFDDGGTGWSIGKSSAFKNMSTEAAAEARREQIRFTEDLGPALKAINVVVKAGAHLEGHSDYAVYWEENKHRILPGYFPDPEQSDMKAKGNQGGARTISAESLKPGYTFEGWRFKGGDPGKKESWEKM